MLENTKKYFMDEIDGKEVSLAIDKAMEESLSRASRTEKIDKFNFFGIDGDSLTYDGHSVNECALPSILEAYKMGGKAFTAQGTTDSKLLGVFGIMSHMISDDAQVIFSDEQMIGIRSSRYKLVPLHEILDEIIPVITSWYSEYVKSEVEMSYSESYIKFFTDKEFKFNGRTRPLTVTLKNSENGESSIWINAYIGRSTLIPIMRGMNITHTKNRATIDELRDRISGLESVVTQQFEKVAELENHRLQKPLAAIDELERKYKFGKVYCQKVKEEIQATPAASFRASDIYEMFAESMLTGVGVSRETLEGYQNDLLKMLDPSFDWSKFC